MQKEGLRIPSRGQERTEKAPVIKYPVTSFPKSIGGQKGEEVVEHNKGMIKGSGKKSSKPDLVPIPHSQKSPGVGLLQENVGLGFGVCHTGAGEKPVKESTGIYKPSIRLAGGEGSRHFPRRPQETEKSELEKTEKETEGLEGKGFEEKIGELFAARPTKAVLGQGTNTRKGLVGGGGYAGANRKRIYSGENLDKGQSPQERLSEKGPLVGDKVEGKDKKLFVGKGYPPRARVRDNEQALMSPRNGRGSNADTRMMVIRFESSYSPAGRVAGIHRIEVRDKEELMVPIDVKTVACVNCGMKAKDGIGRLFDEPNIQGGPEKNDNWQFVMNTMNPPELHIDTSKFENGIGSLVIWNHRPTKDDLHYPGIKLVTVWLGNQHLFSGNLPSPSSSLGEQELCTRIPLSEETQTSKDNLDDLTNRLRFHQTKEQVRNFSRTGDLLIGGDLGSPSDMNSISPSHTEYSKKTKDSNHFKIVPNFNISDEERRSGSGLPGEPLRSQGLMNPSIDSSKYEDLNRRTLTNQERSLSKASRSSQDSKIRNHPKIANSNAKLIFDPSHHSYKGGVSKGSSIKQQSGPITPAKLQLFSLNNENKFGSGSIDIDIGQMGSHRKRGLSSDKVLPLKADHRKVLLSGQSTSSVQMVSSLALFNNQVSADFRLPDTPLARSLRVTLYTNWGDSKKIGLSGIELWDVNGELIASQPGHVSISVTTRQKNNVQNHPDFLGKLIFGGAGDKRPAGIVDPWITDFEDGQPISLEIKFPRQVRLSLVRLWNYNCESPVHTTRCTRHLTIHSQDTLLFFGELPQTSGDREKLLEEAEWVVFTGNKSILKNIENGDWLDSADSLQFMPSERVASSGRFSGRPATSEKPNRESPGSGSCGSWGIARLGDLGSQKLLGLQRAGSGPDHTTKEWREEEISITDTVEFRFLSSWDGGEYFGIRALEMFGRIVLTKTNTTRRSRWGRRAWSRATRLWPAKEGTSSRETL